MNVKHERRKSLLKAVILPLIGLCALNMSQALSSPEVTGIGEKIQTFLGQGKVFTAANMVLMAIAIALCILGILHVREYRLLEGPKVWYVPALIFAFAALIHNCVIALLVLLVGITAILLKALKLLIGFLQFCFGITGY